MMTSVESQVLTNGLLNEKQKEDPRTTLDDGKMILLRCFFVVY